MAIDLRPGSDAPAHALPRRALGTTGLEVSVLGFGASPLGDARITERDADALVSSSSTLARSCAI